MQYLLTLAALGAFSFALAWSGAIGLSPASSVLGPLVLPIAVAIQRVSRGQGRALTLVAVITGCAFAGAGNVVSAGYFGLAALLGVLLGHGIERQWSYGRCVAVFACGAYLFVAGAVLATWDESRAYAVKFLDDQIEQWRDAAGVAGTPDAPSGNETVEDALDTPETAAVAAAPGARDSQVPGLAETVAMFRWLQQHWNETNLGLAFWPILFGALFVVGFTGRWLRLKLRRPGPVGSFREMRPPDALVWAAIAAAVAILADRQWPNEMLRAISWNAGIGLAAVYWVNGLAVAVFTVVAVRLHPLFAVVALVLLFMSPGVHGVLCGVGFFDTWGEFRVRLVRVLEARRHRDEDDDE